MKCTSKRWRLAAATPDEVIIDGYEGRFYRGHSDYSRHVDLRVDLEHVIQQMAEKYIDSQPHLAALYYIFGVWLINTRRKVTRAWS